MRFAIRLSITLLLKLRSITNSSFGTGAAKSARVRPAGACAEREVPGLVVAIGGTNAVTGNHARPRRSPTTLSCRTRQRAVFDVGIEDAGGASGAGRGPGRGAGLLAFWSGP